MPERKPYPSDVSDDEWAFVAPYLTLMDEDAPQRDYPLRETFNALRWLVRAGAPWRLLPNDLPPWHTVYGQATRWVAAGRFEAIVHDLRALLRAAQGRAEQPRAGPSSPGPPSWTPVSFSPRPCPSVHARERGTGGLQRL